ncbi:uncharacterized protein LOC115317763 [Ixodes scapularis]|uniref:uncharacterized protein LOC115317763 n=1 Tax=Ixodes scapularis TaxID=6945 RepID=UPI001A9CBAC6|nr:uncharacterized protein LOC115317763 [Ixodes scapularis]
MASAAASRGLWSSSVMKGCLLGGAFCVGILLCHMKSSQAIEDRVTDFASLDITGMKALLKATLDARKASPSDELPVYFLSPDVLALQEELRFKSSLEDMKAELCEVRETLNRGSFFDIDCYLRPERATFSLIALKESAVDTPFSGPFIIRMRDGEHKITFGKCCVHLPPRFSLECALILCLAVYFILNLSYPYAFGQTLGLRQTVLVKSEMFESCLMSFKLKTRLKEFKNAPSKCTSTEANTN